MTTISNFSGHNLTELPSLDQASIIEVPLVRATPERLRGMGHLVSRFDPVDVEIVPWPTAGWRPLVSGTGNEGGVVNDTFEFRRAGQLQYAENKAVGRSYITGWFADPAAARSEDAPTFTDRILTHEANYHPDGGQIFFPRDGVGFVALLAPPGDDVTAADFRAFYVPGHLGIHINPGVWHQPIFPLADRAIFDDAQGRIHACVSCDFLAEFGGYLSVPLRAVD